MAKKLRICTKCGQPKPMNDFYKDCTKKDGLKSYCKECANGMNKDYYTAKRKKAARKRQAQSAKPVAKATAEKSLLAVARQRKEDAAKATILFSKIVNASYAAVAEAFCLEDADIQIIVKPKKNVILKHKSKK